MPYERDYQQEVEGLTIARGDRLIDVLNIWRYRINALAKEQNQQDISTLSLALIPTLQCLVPDEKSDLGLRAEAIKTLCTALPALKTCYPEWNQTQSALQTEVNQAITTITHALELPIMLTGREMALSTLASLNILPDK